MGNHLVTMVGCDLLGQAPKCERGVEDVDQHLGCDGAHRYHLWPLRVEVVNHNKEPLVMRYPMHLATDVKLQLFPGLGRLIQQLHGWGWG